MTESVKEFIVVISRLMEVEMTYKSIAGIDFTHCEKGKCADCSDAQREKCEREVNKK